MSESDERDIERLFQQAADLPPADRRRFLDEHCPPSSPLRHGVEELLEHLDAAGDAFLDRASSGRDLEGDDATHVPERVGRYEIVRLIGEGGMGMVFEAVQKSPHRRVAVKVMKPLLPSSQLRRFQFESEILGQLKHPAIAHVYEAGIESAHYPDGISTRQPFLAMELIDGVPLNEHVVRAELSLRARLELLVEICEAVQYAHQRGVIHRDLKPANILVDTHDRPKILDFGVARVAEGEIEQTLKTGVGELIGTLPYMSPEQLRGENDEIDTRSDVYALGVILYEVLTGRRPYAFEHGNFAEILDRLKNDTFDPPSRFNRSCKGDLDTIVATALDSDRERRYRSAVAMAIDIRRHLAQEPIEARADSTWYVYKRHLRRHRLPVALGGLALSAVVISAIVAWMMFGTAEQARDVAETQRQQATDRLWESYVARAQLGRASRQPGRRVRSLDALRQASGIRADPVLRKEAIACMALSDLNEITRFESLPGASAHGLRNIDRLAWMEDQRIVYVRLLEENADFARLNGPEGTRAWTCRFSPDGAHLAVEYHEFGDRDLWVWAVGTQERVLALPTGRFVGNSMDFAPDSDRIYLAEIDSTVRAYAIPSGELMAAYVLRDDAHGLRVSTQGSLLAAITGDALEIIDLDAGRTITRIVPPAHVRGLGWTDDDTRIAGAASDGLVYIWNPHTGEQLWDHRLHQADVTKVEILPDDVLLSTGWDGVTRMWDLRNDQPIFDPLRRRTLVGAAGSRLALSDDLKRIAVYRFDRSRELTRIRTDIQFTGPGYLAMHPEGRFLACASRAGLDLVDLETGTHKAHLLSTPTSDLMFTPDGTRLLSLTRRVLREWSLEQVEGAAERSGDETRFLDRIIWEGASATGMCLTPDRTRLIVAGGAGDLVEVDLATGQSNDVPGATLGNEYPSVTPDGRWLFTSTWRGTGGKAIDRHTGAIHREFPGSSVKGQFAKDGRLLVVGQPWQIRVVETGSWRDLFTIEHPERRHSANIAFSPTEEVIAVTLSLHLVKLVDLNTGETLAEMENPDLAAIVDLEFTPDGESLLAFTTDREILCWHLDRIRNGLEDLGLAWE